ncbi:peptidylprolyl isomerase, partial [Bacillus subtilis]
MKKQLLTSLVTAAVLSTAALSAAAQNLAVVNGKAVPKARAEVLKQQIEQSGRPVTPEMEGQI